MTRTINVTVTGGNNLSRIAGRIQPTMQEAALLAAHRVEALAVTRVPERDLDLVNSRRVDEVGNPDGAEVHVGFYTVYARYQHENQLNHTNGREDHYLSSAMSDTRSDAIKIISTAMRRLLAGS